MAEFAYDCPCGKRHEGSPHATLRVPDAYAAQSEEVRVNGQLSRDFCNYRNILGTFHFTRALLAVPIRGTESFFVWNLWVRLMPEDYQRYLSIYENTQSMDEFLSAFASTVPFYASTDGLAIKIKRQPGNPLPLVSALLAQHPLAIHCRDGLAPEDAAKMAAAVCPDANRPNAPAPVPVAPAASTSAPTAT